MPVRGHGEQVGLALLDETNQLVGRITHRQLGRHLQARQAGSALLEVGAVGLDLLGLAQLQIVEVPRGESVGHVHQQDLGVGERGKLPHVIQDGAVGRGVFDGDEDTAVHGAQPAKIWYSIQTFSAAMITATTQARTRIHTGATNAPILRLLPVKLTSGNTANGSCRLRITWLRMSSDPAPRSPYRITTITAGTMATSRVISRRKIGRASCR